MTRTRGAASLPVDPDAISMDEIADRVHHQVLAESALDPASGRPRPDGDDALAERVRTLVRDDAPLLDAARTSEVCQLVLARIVGLGPLEPFLDDPSVTDLMVTRGEVWIDTGGPLLRTPVQLDEASTLHLIERVLAPLGRHADRSNPIVDARLADGSRVHAVVRPLAVDGPCLTIRRFGARAIRIDEVATSGLAAMLTWAVEARCNIVVSGGAGAGKTTLLNALAAAIPTGERVVTIEDAAELRLPGNHVVRLESRPPNAEGTGEVRIRDLVRAALRMRPDRVVVGEVRSGEALDMLQAMNTGHEGSLSTCHASGPLEALRRLETMVLMSDVDLPLVAVRDQIVSAVDLVVHIARGPDGSRRIVAVDEVAGLGRDGRIVTRPLATAEALIALPARAPRSAAGPPSSDWVES